MSCLCLHVSACVCVLAWVICFDMCLVTASDAHLLIDYTVGLLVGPDAGRMQGPLCIQYQI